MAKKASTPTPTPAKATFPEPAKTKAELLRNWWSDKPAGLKWKDIQDEIQKYLEQAGHTFKEASDYLSFLKAGRETGKLTEGKKRDEKATPKKGSFAAFITSIVADDVDTSTLTAAIKIVGQCESVEQATEYAEKFAKLVEALGSPEKVQEAVQLIGE